MQPSKQSLVTFPLEIIIRDLIKDNEFVPVSDVTAGIIKLVDKSGEYCHIQLPTDQDNVDVYDRKIVNARLWNLACWQSSVEKQRKARLLSERRENERKVLEYNVSLLARSILRMAYINPDAARMLAYSDINQKKFAKIQLILGDKKLAQTVEDIK